MATIVPLGNFGNGNEQKKKKTTEYGNHANNNSEMQ